MDFSDKEFEVWSQMIFFLYRRDLGLCLSEADDYFKEHPNEKMESEIESIRKEFATMKKYWRKGVEDQNVEQLYGNLIRRMASVAMEMILVSVNNDTNDGAIAEWGRNLRATGVDWSWSAVKKRLESFVTSVPMAELKGKDALKEVYTKQQVLRSDIFKLILSMTMLSDGDVEELKAILLSPTVASEDQQLIVAALCLGAIRCFDFNKFRILTDVYERSTNPYVKERALVGWALSMGLGMDKIYPEEKRILLHLLEDKNCVQELEKLQQEIIFAIHSVEKSRKIRKDIMNGNIEGVRDLFSFKYNINVEDFFGLSEEETAQRALEDFQEGGRYMDEFERKGGDVFSDAFSETGNLPFFEDPCNWFMPFFKENPALDVFKNEKHKELAIDIALVGNTCNSDKYLFVLTMDSPMSSIPKSFLKTMGKIMKLKKSLDIEVTDDNPDDPDQIRREFVKELHRFLMAFRCKESFFNFFDIPIAGRLELSTTSGYLFLANTMFHDTQIVEFYPEFIKELDELHLEHDVYDQLFCNYKDVADTYDYYMLEGRCLTKTDENESTTVNASGAFAKALVERPDSEEARRLYARSLFREKCYKESLAQYKILMEDNEDDKSLVRDLAACLIAMRRYDEALDYLSQGDLMDSDDPPVKLQVARALLGAGNLDQAMEKYRKQKDSKDGMLYDEKNYLICRWANGDNIGKIAKDIKKLIEETYDLMEGDDDDEEEALANTHTGRMMVENLFYTIFNEDDLQILLSYGVSQRQVALMAATVYDMIFGA